MNKLYSLIQQLLDKRGINKITELSPDEKVEYERWQQIIDGSEVTVDKIKEFCKYQIKVVESKCDGVTSLTPIQQASLHIYLNLLAMIEAPEIDRKNLEAHLTRIINQ